VIAEVIACLCTSSVGFPDFILRGEVRGHLDRNGHGKIFSPARTHSFTFFNFRGRYRFPASAIL
jgi:hypothetical protein